MLKLVGNGTQALVMPLNEASHAEDLAIKSGKPPSGPFGKDGKRRKGWKGFYGSVHDIVCYVSSRSVIPKLTWQYSYPCEVCRNLSRRVLTLMVRMVILI